MPVKWQSSNPANARPKWRGSHRQRWEQEASETEERTRDQTEEEIKTKESMDLIGEGGATKKFHYREYRDLFPERGKSGI